MNHELRCKKHGTRWKYDSNFGVCIWDNPSQRIDSSKFTTPTKPRPDLDKKGLTDLLGGI